MTFSKPNLSAFAAIASTAVAASVLVATPASAVSPCFERGVRPIIAGVLDVKPRRVDPDASLRALGARFRDKVRIADRVERSFGVRVSQREIEYWQYAGDVARSACSRR